MTALPELYTNGRDTLFRNRTRRPAVVAQDQPPAYTRRGPGLTQAQLRWCAANLKAFTWPRVEKR